VLCVLHFYRKLNPCEHSTTHAVPARRQVEGVRKVGHALKVGEAGVVHHGAALRSDDTGCKVMGEKLRGMLWNISARTTQCAAIRPSYAATSTHVGVVEGVLVGAVRAALLPVVCGAGMDGWEVN
jgi:hypothetical protein